MRTKKALLEFDIELWDKFNEDLNPYGNSQRKAITQLIAFFVGDFSKVGKNMRKRLKRRLGEMEK